MRISIVTISYNQAEFLERAIRSVVEQDYEDIEYIVVDPGSTDGSREIIEKYRDRIDKIIFEPDKGPADGLNKGFSHATGDVFGYLNSDDEYLPGSFSKIVKQFSENPTADVIYGHTIIIDKGGEVLRRSFSDTFNIKAFGYGACQIMQASAFFRKNIWKKTKGFNVKNYSNWDGELWHDMFDKDGVFILMNDFLSCYRVHPKSITGSKILDEKIRQYHRIRFRRIFNRDWKKSDDIFCLYWRIRRFLLSPASFFERVRFGPVYGRCKKTS